MPCQQYYLARHLGDADKDDTRMRNAVKASCTSTGVASVFSVVVSS
jgi:hypothetical protein